MLENAEAAKLSDQRIEVDIIFKGLTILVVDDDNNHLSLIRYLLCRYGINVMLADNASLAFELIQQNRVDLLISDIAMPTKDGYWLIQQVRSLPLSPAREIPAIALSGVSKGESYEKALASGFQTYIQKPSNPTYLMEEVAKLL
ncbi:response regulator [Nostoc flagelliforme FACHB-838]|uniref:Response regulator n=1 Tax=Nostoc flagelliforme FACHB-838 TaxID=2692904 RepID=A0ABR8E1Q1_9NOSO|nr:response regulator [Nostoc flagelliforme]MBD2534509.1 response regulator [Nostoc flagelliforme FACHB-838]